ncbi:MAG: hypothetical protein ACUVWK_04275 [Nitrososphaerales archaeon]
MEKDVESEKIRKILLVLDRAKSPVTLDYIFLHTDIKEPLGILERMREEGLVCRTHPSKWSCSMDPMYEIKPMTRKELCSMLVRS